MKYLLLLLSLILSGCASQKTTDKWVSLFDGKTLNGWEALPGGKWEVKDGCLLGSQEKSEKQHGILISKKKYSDFEVKLKYKALKGNSGFYFRVVKINHKVSVKGFQAEIDARGYEIGGLYETQGRAWVVRPTKKEADKYYKMKEWNNMTVRAVGRHVVVHVNGVKTAEIKNDKGNTEGFFGLQLHGGQEMEVYFKDVKIKDLSMSADAGQSFLTDKVHDKTVALPPVKKPHSTESLMIKAKAPKGATVLFDGSSLDNWKGGKWLLKDGIMESNKGNLQTKESFGNGHIHLEWRVVDKDSPGNSGAYVQGMYEVQVFNSHSDRTKIYADGQAAAIYGQYPPAFNVCREPNQWEYYDIHFTAPSFNDDGSVNSKAQMTVFHNGIRVHYKAELTGPTGHYKRAGYKENITTGPLMLQDHGNKIQYRNIWFKAD